MEARYKKMIEGMAPGGPSNWAVYMVRCGDGTFYTGITNDLQRRLTAHNAGKGAAYTRARRPVELLYHEEGFTRSDALRREAVLKSWPRARKQALIDSPSPPTNI